MKNEKSTQRVKAHNSEVNSLDFSPFNENLILTCGSDNLVKLWDSRSLKTDLHIFEWHNNDVFNVSWNNNVPTIFASASSDRRCMIWDISKIGMVIIIN